jgi:hypothetical protein
MKSSTQVFASLVAALATLSQSAIATPSSRVMSQNAIDWQHSSLSVASQATIKDSGQSSSRSFRVADRAVIIDADAISVGSKNRTTILKCSESQPCIEDLLVIDSYKETFGSDGKIEGASIVMYNTSYAPTAIEVYNSKGEFKSVGFVDGKKGGFKDLGDFLKTAASGIVEPFACVIGKGYQQCLNDLKNGKYEITRAEKQLKLQAGDVVRISRGSESARFYAHALQGMDMVDSIISSSEIVKKDPITLKKNFSPELKRKIIEGYIKKKMNDKYTWGMLLKEFGYERNKKAIGTNLDLFNSSLEVAKDIPEDFRKAIIDGTVASKVAGDGLSLLIESTSKKSSIFLDSTLLLSQLTNVYVRSSASEAAYNNPYPLVIAYEKPIKDKTPKVPVRFPDEPSSMPISSTPREISPSLKKTIISRFLSKFPDVNSEKWNVAKPLVSFAEVDLNNDGKKETIVLDRRGFRCSNRSCPIEIFKLGTQNKSYEFISGTGTSRNGLDIAFLPTKSYGWQDLAIQYFSYETRTIDWYAVKFDGKTYKSSSQKLAQVPQNIILSEKSPAFDLGDFSSTQSVAPVAAKPSPNKKTSSHKIGFVKISKSELGQMGNCGYSMIGSKNQNNIVFFTGTNENVLMNIDGENISLKSVSQKKVRRNNQVVSSIGKYESNRFNVTTTFRDMTTSKDRKEFGARDGGSLSVISNDGWNKKIDVECVYDVGG